MWITVEAGPGEGTTAEVTGDRFRVGRDPACDLTIDDPQVSSSHAEFVRNGESYALRDLNSTNGTLVDGYRLNGSTALRGVERVELGQQTVLRLSPGQPGRTVVAPAMAAAGAEVPVIEPAGEVTAVRRVPSATPPPESAAVAAAAAPAPPPPPPAPAPAGGGTGGPSRRTMAIVGGVVVIIGAVVAVIALSGGGGKKQLTQEQLIAQSTPSVVRIQGSTGGGSGVVIDAQRQLVLTNAHVVVGNDALKAQIGNNTTASTPVQLVAASPCDDLAVVKLVNNVPNLKALTLGTSATVRPGDTVTVLGFPGSFQNAPGGGQSGIGQASTVVANTGTVSQVGVQASPDPSLPTYQSLIVHQAPTNHGNSGGPLLNQQGQVIGINTLGNPDNQGQYYSISIDYAKRLLPALEAGHSHGLLGWNLMQLSARDPNLNTELNNLYSNDPPFASNASTLANDATRFLQANPPTTGMYDGGDQPGSPADSAHTSGFLIYKINGTPVQSLTDVCDIVNSASPGQTLRITNYNIDSGNDASQLSAELGASGGNPNYSTDLKVPN
jgi:S1-C subfamily serine protease